MKITISKILFLVAVILLFIAAIGWSLVPNPMIWALLCIALGLFLNGYDLSFKQQ